MTPPSLLVEQIHEKLLIAQLLNHAYLAVEPAWKPPARSHKKTQEIE